MTLPECLHSSLLNSAAFAAIDKDPFLHARMTGCFPPWFYKMMLDHLPDETAYHDLDHRDAKREDDTSTRQQFTFRLTEISHLPIEQAGLWETVHRILTSPPVERAMRRIFRIDPALKLKPRLSLIRDLPGYRIGIHPDVPSKVITCQFYLAKEGDTHEGANFYRRGEGGFELARTMPFEPNTGYAFAVTPSSWHGVNVVTPEQGERNSLMLIYYLEDTPI